MSVFPQAQYGAATVRQGVLTAIPAGRFKPIKRSLAGATAEVSSIDLGASSTGGRMVAGALIAGPIGLLLGAAIKKDNSKAYCVVAWADGETITIEGPRKDVLILGKFADRLNQIARDITIDQKASA